VSILCYFGKPFTSKPIRCFLGLILAHKAVFTIFLFLLPLLFPTLSLTQGNLRQRLSAWDIEHYLNIAAHGYEIGSKRCTFYPLWPACIRVGSWLTGGNAILSAWLLSNLFSLVGLLLFHQMVLENHGLPIANRATLLLLVYPSSMFFFVPYSESLFLLLIMICLLCFQRGLFGRSAVAAFLLPLTRAIGIFILPVLLWELFSKRASWKQYGMCFAPVLGYLGYFGIMYYYTGNAFEGFTAQRQYPAQPSVGKIFDVSRAFHSFVDFSWSHDYLHSFIDRVVFVFFLISLYWIFKLRTGYYVYAFFAGLIPAMSNVFMSFTRFSALVFPLFIVWAQFARKTRTLPFLLMLFFGLQLLFLLLFISDRWAG